MALVARHGPMVLAVCRGVLRDPHDAEDAFQATFLILARKAGSLRVGDSLGGWLHRVAHRVAVEANAGARRRYDAGAAGWNQRDASRSDDCRDDDRAAAPRGGRPAAGAAPPAGGALLPGGAGPTARPPPSCDWGEATVRRRLAEGAASGSGSRLTRRGVPPAIVLRVAAPHGERRLPFPSAWAATPRPRRLRVTAGRPSPPGWSGPRSSRWRWAA